MAAISENIITQSGIFGDTYTNELYLNPESQFNNLFKSTKQPVSPHKPESDDDKVSQPKHKSANNQVKMSLPLNYYPPYDPYMYSLSELYRPSVWDRTPFGMNSGYVIVLFVIIILIVNIMISMMLVNSAISNKMQMPMYRDSLLRDHMPYHINAITNGVESVKK